jgi:hypothetical protein
MSSELPGSAAQPEDGPTAAKLQAYVDANAGRFTDEAITAELVKAGYEPEAIRAALARAGSRGLAPAPTGRAVRAILIAYMATFAILSLGMLTNAGQSVGSYMPDAAGGIVILGMSLGVAFVASLFWIASRRLFVFAIAVILGLVGLGSLNSGISGIVMLGVAVVIGVLAARSSPGTAGRVPVEFGVLLVVPLLLLLVVGGICVASGLPIPRAG